MMILKIQIIIIRIELLLHKQQFFETDTTYKSCFPNWDISRSESHATVNLFATKLKMTRPTFLNNVYSSKEKSRSSSTSQRWKYTNIPSNIIAGWKTRWNLKRCYNDSI